MELSKDPTMGMVRVLAEKAARCSANVLLEGESGVGKTYLARRIHEASVAASRGFRSIFCETEVKSGGEGERLVDCLREEASRWGTIYVKGVDLLGKLSQQILLNYLDERQRQYRNSNRCARLIFSSQKDLRVESARGRFLKQLYLRISVIHIRIPPLRERRKDVISLAHHFITFYSRYESKIIKGLTPEAEDVLRTARWDGNIHELRNVMNCAVVMADDGDFVSSRVIRELLVGNSSVSTEGRMCRVAERPS